METSTPSTAVSATASLAPVPQERRSGLRSWLGGFGASGLLGLAVLLFWLLAALVGPWLLSHGKAAMGTSNVFEPMSAASIQRPVAAAASSASTVPVPLASSVASSATPMV